MGLLDLLGLGGKLVGKKVSCQFCGTMCLNNPQCCGRSVCEPCLVKHWLTAKRDRKKYECPVCAVRCSRYVDWQGTEQDLKETAARYEREGR